ncbi:type IV secretion system protein [Salmonella enterica]|nr:type IV secretion system protein [Salmonella enterica]EFP6579671.1 type IV secretion system protein [Salmonella enterica]EGC7971438.1 type IV secretion system protein [Salmonella enterica]EIV4461663.1 type IV secretion system protein [Salmonella enterica]
MAQFTFFTDLERNIDDMVVSIVNTISDNALTYFLPVVTVGVSISLLWFSLMIYLGNYDNPVSDWIKKMTVIAIVVFIAGAGGLYQRELVGSILGLPSELAAALIDSSSPGMNVLDIAAEQSINKAGEIFSLIGYSPESWLNALVGVALIVSSLFLIGTTAIFFFISKVVVAVLAGLGFIFIFTILWEPLRNFFNNWANQIVHYSLMLVLSALFFSFLMGMYTRLVNQFTVGEANMLYTTFAIVCFSYIGYRLLNEIPKLCQALSNGIAISSLAKAGSNNAPSNNSPSNSGGKGGGGGGGGSSPGEIKNPVTSGSAPFRGK